MSKVFKAIAWLVIVPLSLFLLFLIYMSIADYKPVAIEKLAEESGDEITISDTFNFFNWNVGYCGLGDDMSFFYDGGDNVRTSKERTQENLNSISHLVNAIKDSTDFFFFQEVDIDSKRSYHTNQYAFLANKLDEFFDYFAFNYNVAFVPVPMLQPMGKVQGGLASFSRFQPQSVWRYAFEGNYAWPKGLFLLDRCFMVQRFKTDNEKEFVIINTHNSAYDNGSLRLRQMEMMRSLLVAEYQKGNYVVVGGDWNQRPPGYVQEIKGEKDEHLTNIQIDEDFMPQGWQWIFNDDVASNRLINEVYNPETTETAVIDFYLLSPNVQLVYSKSIDLGFKNSDHQPVVMRVVLQN